MNNRSIRHKTKGSGQEHIPPTELLLRSLIERTKRMPGVAADLERLRTQGADPERVLRFVINATCSVGTSLTCKKMTEQKALLEALARDLNSIATLTRRTLVADWSSATDWAKRLGYEN